jgi:hypothetical protein
MSGLPGFHSPIARVVLRVALAFENLHRRRRGIPKMTGALNITINGVGYTTTRLPVRGRLGGADLSVGEASPT